jgi:hypothetical protein
MSVGNAEIQVQWSSSDSLSVTAAATEASDVFTFAAGAIEAMVTLKGDNAGTPASGDTVDFYAALSCGDPDGGSTEEYPTNVAHMIYLGTIDTYTQAAECLTVTLPVAVKGKVIAKNNAASNAVVVSACINQKVVS